MTTPNTALIWESVAQENPSLSLLLGSSMELLLKEHPVNHMTVYLTQLVTHKTIGAIEDSGLSEIKSAYAEAFSWQENRSEAEHSIFLSTLQVVETMRKNACDTTQRKIDSLRKLDLGTISSAEPPYKGSSMELLEVALKSMNLTTLRDMQRPKTVSLDFAPPVEPS